MDNGNDANQVDAESSNDVEQERSIAVARALAKIDEEKQIRVALALARIEEEKRIAVARVVSKFVAWRVIQVVVVLTVLLFLGPGFFMIFS